MKKQFTGFTTLVAVMFSVPTVEALEVDRDVAPRVTIGGRLIATPSSSSREGFAGEQDIDNSEIDISDSSFLMRFDKRAYDGGVAGAMIGFSKPDKDSDLPEDIYFHQLNAFYWNKEFEVLFGRTRVPNTLVEFPTLRDDDLLAYTHVPNTMSYAENDPYQLIGDVMSFGWHVNPNVTLSAWGGARVETRTDGVRKEQYNLNSGGVGLVYAQPEELMYLRRVRHAGLLVDYQSVDDGSVDDSTYSVVAGTEFNLNNSPLKNWSAGLQYIYNDGIDGVRVADPNGLRRAGSWAAVGSVRLTRRPKLLTRWQGALSMAYKDYDESNASQYSIVPSFAYRLGSGIDFVAQYQYSNLDDVLASVTGYNEEHRIQAGLAFSFDMKFNDTIGERTSILDTEHSYIRR